MYTKAVPRWRTPDPLGSMPILNPEVDNTVYDLPRCFSAIRRCRPIDYPAFEARHIYSRGCWFHYRYCLCGRCIIRRWVVFCVVGKSQETIIGSIIGCADVGSLQPALEYTRGHVYMVMSCGQRRVPLCPASNLGRLHMLNEDLH